MGGFVFLKKNNRNEIHLTDEKNIYNEIQNIFSRKGLNLYKEINHEEFEIYLFSKRSHKTENIYTCGQDFVISTGTFIYDNKVGKEACKSFYKEYEAGQHQLKDTRGHFCLILFHNNQLSILTDNSGVYHVYSDNANTIISNSFLVLAKILSKKTFSKQEFYEYVFTGSFYGNNTFYEEIKLLDRRFIYNLLPIVSKNEKKIAWETFSGKVQYDYYLKEISQDLISYFKILKTVFGNDISAALSGGFDTRLMLALMNSNGIRPKLYVSGEKNDPDVLYATRIAKAEGLDIENYRESEIPVYNPEGYADFVLDRFYCYDSFGVNGVFNSTLNMDICNSTKTILNLNGAGGEIYRNFWVLGSKNISLKSFIKSRFDDIDFSFCTGAFDKREYFSQLELKMEKTLEPYSYLDQRSQVDLLYPIFRLRYWMSRGISTLNQFSYAIAPFSESCFTFKSNSVPIKYKNYGRLEADLIKTIDQRIAKYPSRYGINFYDKMNLKYKYKEFLKLLTPVSVRPLLRKRKSGKIIFMPYYLNSNYIQGVINTDNLFVADYLNPKNVKNRWILSRIYTVELMKQQGF